MTATRHMTGATEDPEEVAGAAAATLEVGRLCFVSESASEGGVVTVGLGHLGDNRGLLGFCGVGSLEVRVSVPLELVGTGERHDSWAIMMFSVCINK